VNPPSLSQHEWFILFDVPILDFPNNKLSELLDAGWIVSSEGSDQKNTAQCCNDNCFERGVHPTALGPTLVVLLKNAARIPYSTQQTYL
jgi:hypothetical protein